MRRTINITIFLCLLSKLGVCELFERLDSTFRQNITNNNFKKSIADLISDKTLTKSCEEISRDIEFNCKQAFYSVSQECYEFQIYLVMRNDTIVLGKLEELDYFHDRKIIKSKTFKLQTKIIDLYLWEYFTYYETKISRATFVREMTSIDKYGFGCGLHRSFFPQSAKKTKRYVYNKNYKKLSNMLVSVVPERKAYATKGLIQLEKAGIQIKEKEKKIINHYKNQNFSVYACNGCLSGPQSLQSVLEWEWR